MEDDTRVTTDHHLIRAWAEDHEAVPASVRGTADDGAGVLTLDVLGHGAGEEDLQHITWDDWFAKFEDSNLAFVFQHQKASGEDSTFFRLVDRDRSGTD